MGRNKAPAPPTYIEPKPEQGLMPTAQDNTRNQGLFNTRSQLESNLNTLSPEYQKAVTDQLQAQHDQALQGLNRDYTDTIQSKTNDLNRRGLFGSSVANEDIGMINRNMGDNLAQLNWSQASNRLPLEQQYQAMQLAPLNYINPQINTNYNKTLQGYNFGASAANSQNSFDLGNYKNLMDYQQQQKKNGSGIGSAIGAALAIGAAPFTGGASLALLPAATGAGSAIGGAF